MLRIISGALKSRIFQAIPAQRSHPMSDRGRMALFNILGDLSQVELVLDAYAGSGALAFEALSRGASKAVAIEIDGRVYRQLLSNARQLGLQEQVKCYRANNVTLLTNLNRQFDLIFLDPPFANMRSDQLLKIAQCLSPQGRLVLSFPPDFKPPFKSSVWRSLHQKRYSNLCLGIYELKKNKTKTN